MLANDINISAPSGYKDFLWAVELHYFGFEIIGLWPKTDKFARLWSEIRMSIILILLIFFLNIPMIYTITQIWDDMLLVINNLQTTLLFVATSVKYVIMRWKRTVFSSIVNMMAEDWMVLKLDSERDVMIRQARIARLIMIFGYFCILIGLFGIFISFYFEIKEPEIMNFTNQDRQLPLRTYYFYDINKSPQYELTCFIYFTTVLFGGITYICIDIFLILITLHICGQLENFRCRLSKLVSCKDFNKTLNNIISTHLRLIRFADNIENTYSLMILIVLFYFGIVFSLSGFSFIILIDKNINKAVIAQVYMSISILFVLLMTTFFYCGAGEFIIEKCNAVYRTLCDLEWYELEPNKARSIIILMIRANHSFCITAGNIIPLTMATFCGVLKTSCGYISFLLTKHG